MHLVWSWKDLMPRLQNQKILLVQPFKQIQANSGNFHRPKLLWKPAKLKIKINVSVIALPSFMKEITWLHQITSCAVSRWLAWVQRLRSNVQMWNYPRLLFRKSNGELSKNDSGWSLALVSRKTKTHPQVSFCLFTSLLPLLVRGERE